MSKDVIWSATTRFYSRAKNDINSNVNRTDWIGFLDAMGWMENGGKYGGISPAGFAGMYQCDTRNLDYYHFLNGVGKQFLGVTTKSQFADNPIAQDLAAIMEFSGMPKVTIDPTPAPFSSVYLAVRAEAKRLYGLENAIFDQLIGKTVTISFTGEGAEEIILTKEGISSAAHLVGAGKMAEAMTMIYNKCFSAPAPVTGIITQTSSIATFPREGFADGNNVAFSTYARLLQDYDISSLLNANNFADFNALVSELIAWRKDKIINYLTSFHPKTLTY